MSNSGNEHKGDERHRRRTAELRLERWIRYGLWALAVGCLMLGTIVWWHLLRALP